MSLRVAALLSSLLFFSAFAVAQITAPSCTSGSWKWTSNSLGQGPCDVAAYMMSTCNKGEYIISPLSPGDVYGPRVSDLCHCNTVGYSLVSACGACQGNDWEKWSEWVTNCPKTLPPASYPNPVPSGMHLPHWALLDVTNENNWNPNKSYADTSSPEILPGTTLSPSGVSNSVTPSSKTGAIVGGTVACVVAILIAIVAIFYLRQRSRERLAMSAGAGAFQPERPLSDGGTLALSSLSVLPVAMRFYDPNNLTTSSGKQGGPQSLGISSQIGIESTLDHTMQPLQPQDTGYHGHPAVWSRPSKTAGV